MANAFAASTCLIEPVCKIGRLVSPCDIVRPPDPDFNPDFRDVEIPPPLPVFPPIPYIGDCNIDVDNCKGTVTHQPPCDPVCAFEVYTPKPGGGVKVSRIEVDKTGHVVASDDCDPLDSSFLNSNFSSYGLPSDFSSYNPGSPASSSSSFYSSYNPPTEYSSSFYSSTFSSVFSSYGLPPDFSSTYSSLPDSYGIDCPDGLVCWYKYTVLWDCINGGWDGDPGLDVSCDQFNDDPYAAEGPEETWNSLGMNLPGTHCIFAWHKRSPQCCTTPGLCDNPPDFPGNPDATGCCTSSYLSSYASSHYSSYNSSHFNSSGECPEGMTKLAVVTDVECNGDGTITVTKTDICTFLPS